MKHKILIFSLAFLLTAMCGTIKSQVKRVAFVTNNASDYWTMARKGTEKADAELDDISVEFKIPSEGTVSEQTQILNELVASGISAIAVSPVDPENEAALINEISKNALVITQDSDSPTSDRAVFIGADNKAAGKQAGELIKQALPKGGKIMIFVGRIDAPNARERYEGIKEALEGSKIQIIDVRTDDADFVRAQSNVADALVKNPDIAGLVGLWSYNGPAILNAVKAAKKVKKVKIICFDEENETLAGIKKGQIYGTIVQQPYETGYRAIHLMAKIIKGDKSEIPAGKQIFVPTLVVKKDTVEEFEKNLKQLRGK